MARGVIVSLVALAVLAPVLPLASAQVGEASVDMSLPNLGEPINPGNPQNNTVNVRYTWDRGITQEPTELELSVVEEPSWLNSSFHPSTLIVNNTTQSPRQTAVKLATVTLDVAEDAPAYAEGTATYKVVAKENGLLPRAEATADFPVTAGFRGTVDVHLPAGDNVTAWGGVVTEIPIEMTNRANGPLLVEVTVARSPADAIVTPPTEVRVNAADGDRVARANLEVQVPWSVSESGPVIVELSPTHAEKGTPAKTVEARFQLNGNSAVPVPGPGPWIALGVTALAALAARRER